MCSWCGGHPEKCCLVISIVQTHVLGPLASRVDIWPGIKLLYLIIFRSSCTVFVDPCPPIDLRSLVVLLDFFCTTSWTRPSSRYPLHRGWWNICWSVFYDYKVWIVGQWTVLRAVVRFGNGRMVSRCIFLACKETVCGTVFGIVSVLLSSHNWCDTIMFPIIFHLSYKRSCKKYFSFWTAWDTLPIITGYIPYLIYINHYYIIYINLY